MHRQAGLVTLLSRQAKGWVGLARPPPRLPRRALGVPSGSGQGSCKTDEIAASTLRQVAAWETSLWLRLSVQPWQGAQGLASRETGSACGEGAEAEGQGGGPPHSSCQGEGGTGRGYRGGRGSQLWGPSEWTLLSTQRRLMSLCHSTPNSTLLLLGC